MAKREKPEFIEMVFNILGYREGNEWVALALEMDLRGYGDTWEKALSELRDLVSLQISFAHFKKQPAMIYEPADPVWFQLFADSRSAKLRSESQDAHYLTGALPIPPQIKSIIGDRLRFHQFRRGSKGSRTSLS